VSGDHYPDVMRPAVTTDRESFRRTAAAASPDIRVPVLDAGKRLISNFVCSIT